MSRVWRQHWTLALSKKFISRAFISQLQWQQIPPGIYPRPFPTNCHCKFHSNSRLLLLHCKGQVMFCPSSIKGRARHYESCPSKINSRALLCLLQKWTAGPRRLQVSFHLENLQVFKIPSIPSAAGDGGHHWSLCVELTHNLTALNRALFSSTCACARACVCERETETERNHRRLLGALCGTTFTLIHSSLREGE